MPPDSLNSRVLLSRYFDENTYLVAGMCWKCYNESIDLKITGANCTFVNQAKIHPYSKNINGYSDIFFELDDAPNDNQTSIEEFGNVKESSLEKDLHNDKKPQIDCSYNSLKQSSPESSNFCGFNSGQYSDYSPLTEINKIILKIEHSLSEIRSSDVLVNIKDIRGNLNDCKENLKFLGFNTKEFDQNMQMLDRINQIVKKAENSIHQILLRQNSTHQKEAAGSEFYGFEQADYETSQIIVSKLNAVIRRLKTWCRKLPKLDKNLNVQTIKREPIDEFETISKFFPSQTENDHEFNFKKEFKVKIEDLNDEDYVLSQPIWHPPKSPHHLIEEDLYHDPWALLVATIFLNRTRAKHARDYIDWFLKDYTTPFSVLKTEPPDLEKYFENIGLKVVRSVQVWRMSYDFVFKNWIDVKDLYGVGRYSRDAFNMFCLGNLEVEPKDRYLRIYKAWYDRVYLKKDVNFYEKFFEAKRCKNDEWLSDESDSGSSDINEFYK